MNPEQLGEWILEDFTALIDRLYPKDKIPDPLDQEAMRHEAYAQSRRLAFIGRSELLIQMDKHAGAAGAKPLVLTGESGCGKSALLAEWAARWHLKNREYLIIQHYMGSRPESADWQGLVRRILGELKHEFDITAKLESTPAACNALYLRAVLDELRQFGKHEELEAKAFEYLKAPDLATLFDLILTRWLEDFGTDRDHPDLVRRSLCLIACSRFGLSEAELLDLLGKKNGEGKYEPLPRRPWTPFYLAAENALAQRAGLLTFGHDYLRAAVERRHLVDGVFARHFRLQLSGYFGNIHEPTDRKLDELPTLLRDTGRWKPLKDLLADLPTFKRLREHRRWKWELHGFWLAIGKRYDPIDVYN